MTSSSRPGGEIRALTGLRIVAAAWVVMFHLHWLLSLAYPGLDLWAQPILTTGAQGVDLFFLLSGFVLTLNYGRRIGDRITVGGAARFLWARISRVYPVYLVTMHVAVAWLVLRERWFEVAPHSEISALSYLQQLLLIQQWFRPGIDDSSWNGPAWSISAEWLAYVIFVVVIVVLVRVARASSTRQLLILAVLVAMAPAVLLIATGQYYSPFSWALRLIAMFIAGCLTCEAMLRTNVDLFRGRVAGWLSLVIAGVIIASIYGLAAIEVPGVPDDVGLVNVLFVPWLFTLAIGKGGLVRLLESRAVVYGGRVSYSLYLIHGIVFNVLLVWMQNGAPLGSVIRVLPAVVLAVSLGSAVLLYHLIEEPARTWMGRALPRPVSADAQRLTARHTDADRNRRTPSRRSRRRVAGST